MGDSLPKNYTHVKESGVQDWLPRIMVDLLYWLGNKFYTWKLFTPVYNSLTQVWYIISYSKASTSNIYEAYSYDIQPSWWTSSLFDPPPFFPTHPQIKIPIHLLFSGMFSSISEERSSPALKPWLLILASNGGYLDSSLPLTEPGSAVRLEVKWAQSQGTIRCRVHTRPLQASTLLHRVKTRSQYPELLKTLTDGRC